MVLPRPARPDPGTVQLNRHGLMERRRLLPLEVAHLVGAVTALRHNREFHQEAARPHQEGQDGALHRDRPLSEASQQSVTRDECISTADIQAGSEIIRSSQK